jgi:hypothetical protein
MRGISERWEEYLRNKCYGEIKRALGTSFGRAYSEAQPRGRTRLSVFVLESIVP